MANETVRYCQAGHAFKIQGDMSVGNTITVTVEPLSGYRFVRWNDGNSDNPRQIYISECGVTYVGIFEEDSSQNFEEVFDNLSVLVDGPDYSYVYLPSTIELLEIEERLEDLIGD